MANSHPIPTTSNFQDLTGLPFGRLTVIEYAGKDDFGVTAWRCRCSCGGMKTIRGQQLRSGKITDCDRCEYNMSDADHAELVRGKIQSRSTPVESGCWEWQQAGRHRFGYGRIHVRGTTLSAHVASWLYFRGPIPAGLFVLHKCDNPPCCNPDHLFLGTQKVNIDDMCGKGRQPRGETIGVAKLTADQVASIRSRYASGGVSQYQLAREFGVTRPNIGSIIRGDTWRHVSEDVPQ